MKLSFIDTENDCVDDADTHLMCKLNQRFSWRSLQSGTNFAIFPQLAHIFCMFPVRIEPVLKSLSHTVSSAIICILLMWISYNTIDK